MFFQQRCFLSKALNTDRLGGISKSERYSGLATRVALCQFRIFPFSFAYKDLTRRFLLEKVSSHSSDEAMACKNVEKRQKEDDMRHETDSFPSTTSTGWTYLTFEYCLHKRFRITVNLWVASGSLVITTPKHRLCWQAFSRNVRMNSCVAEAEHQATIKKFLSSINSVQPY